MKDLIVSLFWMTLSSKLNLEVSSTKKIILNLTDRLKSNSLDMNTISPDVYECLDIYLEFELFLK